MVCLLYWISRNCKSYCMSLKIFLEVITLNLTYCITLMLWMNGDLCTAQMNTFKPLFSTIYAWNLINYNDSINRANLYYLFTWNLTIFWIITPSFLIFTNVIGNVYYKLSYFWRRGRSMTFFFWSVMSVCYAKDTDWT